MNDCVATAIAVAYCAHIFARGQSRSSTTLAGWLVRNRNFPEGEAKIWHLRLSMSATATTTMPSSTVIFSPSFISASRVLCREHGHAHTYIHANTQTHIHGPTCMSAKLSYLLLGITSSMRFIDLLTLQGYVNQTHQ